MQLKYHKPLTYLLLCVASLDALAWQLSHDTLLAWMPWFKNMTFNTAFGFVCLSLAILFLRPNTTRFNLMARFLLLGWGIFASLSLAQDVFQVNLGLDQWFQTLPQATDHIYAGRMSPLTAMAFMTSCLILLMYRQPFKYVTIITQTLILLLILLALQGLSLHFFHIHADHSWAHLASMSLMTSFSFFLIILIALSLFRASNVKEPLLLYVGLHLMYRLSYPQKFTLISLVMLIPLFVFMSMKWQDLNASIEHSEMELVGMQHIQQTSTLALAIAEHRGMSHAHFSDPSLFQQELVEKNIQINEIFARNRIMDQLNQGYISIPKEWEDVLAMWHAIQGESLDAEQSWLLHSNMTKILNNHLRSIGRESLLSYDHAPLLHDLVAFQLMILPELVENLGQIRGQGARVLTQEHITSSDVLNIDILKPQVHFLLHESDEVLSNVWTNKGIPTLHKAYQQLHQKTEAFLVHRLSEPTQVNAEAYFQQGSHAIQAVTHFNQISMAYVQQQLSQRTGDKLTAKYLVGLTALWVILLIFYLFFSFYQSVMLTIQSLQNATERMRKGDMNILSESPTQDELGHVVTSFNSIAHELLQLTGRMHAMVEYAVDGIVTIKASGEICHVNSAAERIFAYPKGEILGKNVTFLMPEYFRKRHQDGLRNYLATGEQKIFGCVVEVEGLRKNQETFPLTISINEMQVDGERMFVAMMRDISDYKKLEQQLRQAEKMEAIGELVAGVAHNFNNMLSSIGGKTYLAKLRLEKQPEKVSKYLDSIENIVKQAASMIQQLLIFSKQDFLKHKSNLSLNNLIHDAYARCMLGIPEDISVTLNFLDQDMMVYGDSDQLEQVILQLLNNASDAVHESDVKNIEISLSLPDMDVAFYQRHDQLKQIQYVCLTVSDTGHGMTEAIQSRIFDPFYSTKEVGKGTGLGLSSVLGSIDSHEGVIEVESEPLAGTRFHVYLPLIEVATSRLQETHMDAVSPAQQQGMLLLVDDDATVMEAHQEVFEALGYQVLVASDGEQGLQCFEQHQEHIIAVVTDVVMPNMGGVQMMQRIRQISPDLPVVYITGYEKGSVNLSESEKVRSCILSKPINIEHLFETIQTLLKE